jgi:methionine synthase II (cobalamin-independent)
MPSSIHLRPPFRAEHVGSLLRPKALYEKRQALEAKECSLSDLRPVEDEAIKHVVKLQQELGIKTITDGELRRYVGRNYLSAFAHTINA